MRRTRLACLVATLLALSGAWAGPVRSVESTRLVATCAWPVDGNTQTPNAARVTRQHLSIRSAAATATSFTGTEAGPARTLRLPHHLFQRPPPGNS